VRVHCGQATFEAAAIATRAPLHLLRIRAIVVLGFGRIVVQTEMSEYVSESGIKRTSGGTERERG
jgi:hypothetical protein